MTVQLTSKSFRDVLTLSRLVAVEDIERLCDQHPEETAHADSFAKLLVTERVVTQWQADKLLQAKHRGFFLGNYKLCSLLAKGGMSTIYVAEQVETQQICALKILPPSRSAEASYLPRFLREADIASRLEHPNIVRVFDLHNVSDGKSDVYFMAMELLHGADLSEEVNLRGPLSIRVAADVVRQTAVGLDYAHAAGLVHRDIKPGNLFRTLEGDIRILDLGLASMLEGEQENLTRQYNERVLGTADYLAPEQAVDSHRADSRADIYALGATLYFMLTGQPPFNEGSLPQRILAHQTKQPRPVTELRPDVPPEIVTLLEEMMVKKRSRRIQTAGEVAERFQRWLSANESVARLSDRPRVTAQAVVPAHRSSSDAAVAEISPHQKAPTDPPGRSETKPFRETRQPETPPVVASAESAEPVVQKSAASAEPAHTSESGSQYASAFEEFLQRLDEQSGAATVMSVSALAERHRMLSAGLDAHPAEFDSDDINEGDSAIVADDSDVVAVEKVAEASGSLESQSLKGATFRRKSDSAIPANPGDGEPNRWLIGIVAGLAAISVLALASQVEPLRQFFRQLLGLPG